MRKSNGEVDYYFGDHLGSSRVLANSTGTLLDDQDFFPFGGTAGGSSTSGNNYKFTGKERDAESVFDYFEARYAGSNFSRFLSPDPLGGHQLDPQTLNRYSYVRNNPLNLTDPTGLDFNLSCTQTKDNSSTCQGGVQGTTTTDADGKSTFNPTVINNGKDGNLVDQNGNKYSGTFDGQNVNFSKEGSNQSSKGVWKQGTNDTTGIRGSGDFDHFDFTFKNHNAVQTLFAEFTFHGTPDQARSALRKGGI